MSILMFLFVPLLCSYLQGRSVGRNRTSGGFTGGTGASKAGRESEESKGEDQAQTGAHARQGRELGEYWSLNQSWERKRLRGVILTCFVCCSYLKRCSNEAKKKKIAFLLWSTSFDSLFSNCCCREKEVRRRGFEPYDSGLNASPHKKENPYGLNKKRTCQMESN